MPIPGECLAHSIHSVNTGLMNELSLVSSKPHGGLHLLSLMKFGAQPSDTQLRGAEQGLDLVFHPFGG